MLSPSHYVILTPSHYVILTPSHYVILTPSLYVILSRAKNLSALRLNSAKHLRDAIFRPFVRLGRTQGDNE